MTRSGCRELIRDMSLRLMELNLVLQQMGHADNGGLFGKGKSFRRRHHGPQQVKVVEFSNIGDILDDYTRPVARKYAELSLE